MSPMLASGDVHCLRCLPNVQLGLPTELPNLFLRIGPYNPLGYSGV